MTNQTQILRQGLPRHPGGKPWPPTTFFAAEPQVQETAPAVGAMAPEPAQIQRAVPDVAAEAAGPAPAASAPAGFTRPDLRQGLPRVANGDPWPPRAELADSASAVPVAAAEAPSVPAVAPSVAVAASAPRQGLPSPSAENPAETPLTAAPIPGTSSTKPQPLGTKKDATSPKTTLRKVGVLTVKQWMVALILGVFCAMGIVTAVVLGARWLIGFDTVGEFVARYPGEYQLPDNAPVGVPAWLGWQHFFNLFLMVLIIRSGLQVRHQQKPAAYWSSKRSPKVNINLWLHQSLDVLWLVNGLVFIILLFATGHWMRIVPTSWEVFPNALSAGLQYLTLDWPTENGWVNYNSLQQLAYFATVFVAAPLAAITGYRMSAFWPKNAGKLTSAYPLELARKLHFPVMLYFVVFIFIHVALVLSTGALRNLNHMYAAQGSVDPNEFAENWTGLWMFAAALLVISGAWAACRPMLLAPIARLFGTVSRR